MVKVEFHGVGAENNQVYIIYKATPGENESIAEIEEYCEYLELIESNYEHYVTPNFVSILQFESSEITAKKIEWYRDWHEGFIDDYYHPHESEGNPWLMKGRLKKYRENDAEYREKVTMKCFWERRESWYDYFMNEACKIES